MKRRSLAHRGAARAGLLAAGATVALLGPLAAAATASVALVDGASQPVTLTVADAAEAWYASSPIDICTTPLGCPPAQVPTSPYPADTLHVGVAGGQETARTYLLPDLTAMPFGSTMLKATMTLPVATDSQAGNAAANTAKMQACLVTAPFPDGTQGSTQAPPAIDCKTAVAKPKYDAKKNLFTIDLSPFFTSWQAGLINGIALVPDSTGTQPTDAWHVAFNGRKRANTSHISTTLTYRAPVTPPPPTTGGGGSVAPPVTSAPPPTSTQPPPAGPLPGSVSSAPAQAPPVVAPQQTNPQPVAQAPVALSREFQYPLAFLVPLALLAGAWFFTRLFTRDATPLRSR